MKNVLLIKLIFFNYSLIECVEHLNVSLLSKTDFPYFRRKVEEIPEDDVSDSSDESQSKFVSFLVENVNEIFKNTPEETTPYINDKKGDVLTHKVLYGYVANDQPHTKARKEVQSTLLFRPTIADKNRLSKETNAPKSTKSTPSMRVRYSEPRDTLASVVTGFTNVNGGPNDMILNKNVIVALGSAEIEKYLTVAPTHTTQVIYPTPAFLIDLNILYSNVTTATNFPDNLISPEKFVLSLEKDKRENYFSYIPAHTEKVLSPKYLIDRKTYNVNFSQIDETASASHLKAAPKDLLFLGKQESKQLRDSNGVKPRDNVTLTTMNNKKTKLTTEPVLEQSDLKRSCIMCDNVAVPQCSAPKNNLIPSVVCAYQDSLCYSQHTPFGIVDRGCLSVFHNMTTYVCACNLCNSVSITDMPILFSTKREWISNVYELSHNRRLKKSVFKDMACLRCESSTGAGDVATNLNCLEGVTAKLETQKCAENEICAVKAIKSQGYIWRGCVSFPLFNYYMTLCDSDLCNYDPIVSVYDPA